MKAKKVKVEVVKGDISKGEKKEDSESKNQNRSQRTTNPEFKFGLNLSTVFHIMFFKIKLIFSIIMDIIDYFLVNVPTANLVWDILKTMILLAITKNKLLVIIVANEFILSNLAYTRISSFIPTATIITLADYGILRIQNKNNAFTKIFSSFSKIFCLF